MKLLQICFLLVLAACVKSGDDDPMMKVVMGCKKMIDASDDDLQKFMVHAPAENQKQKCLCSCILIGLEIIKDNKLCKTGFMMMADKIVGADPAKLKVAAGIFETCEKVNDPEPCENAAKIADCLKTEGDNNNIDFSF